MPLDEFVYDHNGEQLFFYSYSPDEIPVYNYFPEINIDKIHAETYVRGINWGSSVSYSGKGIDCDCVPTFAHFTADYLGTHRYETFEFEPLTVGMVVKWFGWFLLQLDNSYLQIGKSAPPTS